MDNALAAGQSGIEAAPQLQTLAHQDQPNTPQAQACGENGDPRQNLPREDDSAEDSGDDARRATWSNA